MPRRLPYRLLTILACLSFSFFSILRADESDRSLKILTSKKDRLALTNTAVNLGLGTIERIVTKDGYFFIMSGDKKWKGDMCTLRQIKLRRSSPERRSFEVVSDIITTNFLALLDGKPKLIELRGGGLYSTATNAIRLFAAGKLNLHGSQAPEFDGASLIALNAPKERASTIAFVFSALHGERYVVFDIADDVLQLRRLERTSHVQPNIHHAPPPASGPPPPLVHGPP
jgi:hypothetical protein